MLRFFEMGFFKMSICVVIGNDILFKGDIWFEDMYVEIID